MIPKDNKFTWNEVGGFLIARGFQGRDLYGIIQNLSRQGKMFDGYLIKRSGRINIYYTIQRKDGTYLNHEERNRADRQETKGGWILDVWNLPIEQERS